MNTQEIREAVKRGNKMMVMGDVCPCDEKYLKVLIDLATRYLEVVGVMPKKKRYTCGNVQPTCQCKDCLKADAYNEAIDDCTLAITRKLERLEDVINNEISKWEVNPFGQCIPITDIATAIRSHIVGNKTKGE